MTIIPKKLLVTNLIMTISDFIYYQSNFFIAYQKKKKRKITSSLYWGDRKYVMGPTNYRDYQTGFLVRLNNWWPNKVYLFNKI